MPKRAFRSPQINFRQPGFRRDFRGSAGFLSLFYLLFTVDRLSQEPEASLASYMRDCRAVGSGSFFAARFCLSVVSAGIRIVEVFRPPAMPSTEAMNNVSAGRILTDKHGRQITDLRIRSPTAATIAASTAAPGMRARSLPSCRARITCAWRAYSSRLASARFG